MGCHDARTREAKISYLQFPEVTSRELEGDLGENISPLIHVEYIHTIFSIIYHEILLIL